MLAFQQEQEELPFLEGLNPAQLAAVKDTEGPILVMAGAGSGKTAVLVKRVTYLLHLEVPAYRILCITFTNKASKEMKKRALAMNRESHRCWIGTFHSICNRILLTHYPALGYDPFVVIDSNDQEKIIKAFLKTTYPNQEFDKKEPDMILTNISHWKNQNLLPGTIVSASARDGINQIHAQAYQYYEDVKNESGYFDFDDLLVKTIRLFQVHPEVLEQYQRQFKYIMIDEVQDTNPIQFELVNLLSARHGNLFAVGDGDQSIYKWRGARVENMIEYSKNPEVKVHRLEQNYRSTQCIVNASNALISHNTTRLEKTSYSMAEPGSKIQKMEFEFASKEAEVVANLFRNLKFRHKMDWSDMAILYRSRRQSGELEKALNELRIPYNLVGSISFFDRKEIKTILHYLRSALNPHDDLALEEIINVPKRAIGDTTINKILLFAEERQISVFSALQQIDAVAQAYAIKQKKTIAAIKDFVSIIEELHEEGKSLLFNAQNFLRLLFEKTNFIDQYDITKEEDEVRIEHIQEFISIAADWDRSEREHTGLQAFLMEMNLTKTDIVEEEGAVTLTTVHSAKGLEWKTVAIVGLEEGTFPSAPAIMENEVEEERRLLYVAMTRAEKLLFLTYNTMRHDYRSAFPIGQVPSRFFQEIPEEYFSFHKQLTVKR
jgi:DNA helicase II / ATP-dependent DNA helicase PcrA